MITCERCHRQIGACRARYSDGGEIECFSLTLARVTRERDEARLELQAVRTSLADSPDEPIDIVALADAVAFPPMVSQPSPVNGFVDFAERPIESLGPVPATEEMLDAWEVELGPKARMLAYLARDAVRRGAKLEES